MQRTLLVISVNQRIWLRSGKSLTLLFAIYSRKQNLLGQGVGAQPPRRGKIPAPRPRHLDYSYIVFFKIWYYYCVVFL
jgi:hypothetical protein